MLAPLVANDLLADVDALRQRVDRDGYLFFRSIVAREVLTALRDTAVPVPVTRLHCLPARPTTRGRRERPSLRDP